MAVVLLGALLFACGMVTPGVAHATTVTFTAQEMLGKPTNNSITVNVVPAAAIQYYYRYGTSSGSYTGQTSAVDATGGQPSEVTISGLAGDTKYYYQMVYDGDGSVTDGSFETGTEHSFHTARAAGDTFTFSVTSDGHAGNTNAAFTNILSELPDFNVDMGDTFITDGISNQTSANNKYLAQRTTSTMGKAGVSVPIFLSAGNHEQEEGWHFADGQAQASIQARKLLFPTPTPVDGPFYTANTDILSSINATTYGDQYREDYYAWTWGDALFVVIDPFQYTPDDPYGSTAGDGGTKTGDQWSWSLGKQQYDWLKATLEGSDAKYKFVFSHNMVGGCAHSESGTNYPGYVRGGAECAAYFEWGGYTTNTNTYDFDTKRPGWGEPIEQLLIESHVSAYFHGHDHQFAYETRDGIAYIECPSPGSMGAFSGCYTVGTHTDPAGSYNTLNVQSISQAHLKITVTPNQATVDLMNSSGTSAYSNTIAPYTSPTTPSVDLKQGWNLVAGAPGTVFPGVLFGWDGTGYTSVVEIAAWQGFWCKTTQDQTVDIETLTGPHTIDLSVGWNLIGNCLATDATLQLPAGASAFVYDPEARGYVSVTALAPGQGAWVKGTASGQQVTLTGT